MIDARSRAAAWFERIQALGSYAAMISEPLPQPVVDLFRGNAEAVSQEVQALLADL